MTAASKARWLVCLQYIQYCTAAVQGMQQIAFVYTVLLHSLPLVPLPTRHCSLVL